MLFVGREKELHSLKMYLNEVKRGEGKVILLEGPAGIGKSYLIDKFLEDNKDVQILKTRCEQSTQYVPYNAISQALGSFGTLSEIKRNEWKRKIREISKKLYKENKMVFVDEIGYGGGYRLYKELSKRMKGLYFTIRQPSRSDAIWLTETKTDKESINPYNLEFEFVMYLHEFLNSSERKLVYIEDLNFLVYIAGIDRVVDFLHTLRSLASNRHLIIISGKIEYLSEKERHLLSLFDEKILIEWEDKITPPTIILTDRLRGKNVLRLTNKKDGGNTLYISPQGIHPTRLDFEIFEKIAEAIDNGMDIAIECLNTIVHYNDKRKVYIWLKAVRDYARKNGRRVYLVERTPISKDIEFFFDLIDEGKDRIYGGMDIVEGPVKFYDVIHNFLDYNSRRKPMILVFEDIQWIDSNSLELIYYLARNIGKGRIMIILTYRNEDIVENKNLLEILTNIQDEPTAKVLRLKPLKEKDIEDILYGLGYRGDVGSIYEISEGNPLLAINMAKYIMQGNKSSLPETIRESVELQVDKLKEHVLNFIRFLSVVGYEIPLSIVESFYPEYKQFLEDPSNIFVILENKKLRFIYPIYREIIYKGISRDTRINFHRKIGNWAERNNDLFMAAYHYYMARDERAIGFLRIAAEESAKMMAFKSAIDYLQKALEIAEKYGKVELIGELYRDLGEWYVSVGEYKKAAAMFSRATEYLPEDIVYFGTQMGMCYRLMGELNRAKEILNEYLKIAKGMDKGRIIGELGIIEWETGDFKESLEKLGKYLAYAQRYESKIDEVKATRNIASVYYMEGNYKKALKYAEKALRLAEESGDIREIADTYNVIGVINNHLNNYEEALTYLLKYLEISEKMGNLTYLSRAYNNIGVTYEKMGDLKKAEEYHKRAIEIIEKLGNDRLLEAFHNNIAVLYSRHGNYSLALEHISKSLEISIKLNNKYGICERLVSLGEINAEMGKYMDAIDFYSRAMEIAKMYSYTTILFSIYLYMARAYVHLEEFKKAQKYIELSHSLKKNVQESYLIMDYYLVNAEYDIALGNWDMVLKWLEKAKENAKKINDVINSIYIEVLKAYSICQRDDKFSKDVFESAIKDYGEMDYKIYLAKTYYYYGLCLLKKNKKEWKNKINKAIKLYEEMGLEDKLREVKKKVSGI